MKYEKVLDSWREQDVILNQNAPTEIDFLDTEPNHIVLTNNTSNTMYIAQSSNVSSSFYEMKVVSGGTKMFAKPKGMSSIFIWHASNQNELVHIVSFVDDFNPQSIAQTSETVNTQNVVLSPGTNTIGLVKVTDGTNNATFTAAGEQKTTITQPLPAGTNVLGHVNVDSLPTLPAGTNNIGHVTVDTLPSLPAGTNNIGAVTKVIQGSMTDRSGTITTGGTAQQAAPANASRKFLLLQNVSSADLWFNLGVTAVINQPSIKLAAGEKLPFTEFVPTDLISIIGATTGQAFTIKEA